MRSRTVLLLLCTALLLGGYIVLVERHQPDTDELAAQRRRVLPGLRSDDVRLLRIVGPSRPAIELRRMTDGWRLVSPLRAVADAALVRKILSSIEFLDGFRRVAAGTNLRQVGLAPPRLRLKLQLDDKREAVIAVGAGDASGTGVYVRAANGIFVVPAVFLRVVDVDADDLRDRDLVHFPLAELTAVALKRGDEVLRLARHQGVWTVDDGRGPIAAHPTAVLRLIGALTSLRARRFIDRASDRPLGLEVRLQAGLQRQRLVLGTQCPGHDYERVVWRQQAGTWERCCVDNEDLASLSEPAERLVETALTWYRVSELSRLALSGSKSNVDLIRDGATWRFASGHTAADGDAIREWVQQFTAQQGELQRLDEASDVLRSAMRPVKWTLRLERERGGTQTLRFGAVRDGRIPVRRDQEPALLWIPQQFERHLTVDRLTFRDRLVLQLPRYQLRRVSIQRRGEREVLQRTDGKWRVVEPVAAAGATLTLDERRLSRLLERLAALRVLRFSRQRSKRHYTIVVEGVVGIRSLSSDAQDERVHRLRLTSPHGGGGCQGEMQGQPPFVLSAADCSLFSEPLTSFAAKH